MDFESYQKLLNDERNRTSENMAVRFYDRVVNSGKIVNGIAQMMTVCYCEIRIKDNITEVFDQPATKEKIERYPVEYARYKLSKKQSETGNDLSKFGFLTIDEIASCKAHGIFTIEALAELPEINVKKLGFEDYQRRAQEFVNFNASVATESELSEKIEQLESSLAATTAAKDEAEAKVADMAETSANIAAKLSEAKVKIAELEQAQSEALARIAELEQALEAKVSSKGNKS